MKIFIFVFGLIAAWPAIACGQSTSEALTDTAGVSVSGTADSLRQPTPDLSALIRFQKALAEHPYYHFFQPSLRVTMEPRRHPDTDPMFYALLVLVLYYALIHAIFGRYLYSLTALFFRVSMRQQQLREQIWQSQLPGLLLNILFVVSGGLYAAFLARHYHWIPDAVQLREAWLYCSAFLLVVYTGKFLLLKITGWIFKVSSATDTYISVVFMVNKVLGIALIPVLWVLAFPHPAIYQVVITLSEIMVIGLFLYRFFISYRPVRNEIKVSPFHFFIYLCAFEIAPLLLIYKVLIKLVDSSF